MTDASQRDSQSDLPALSAHEFDAQRRRNLSRYATLDVEEHIAQLERLRLGLQESSGSARERIALLDGVVEYVERRFFVAHPAGPSAAEDVRYLMELRQFVKSRTNDLYASGA
jgi:hypothetical protein